MKKYTVRLHIGFPADEDPDKIQGYTDVDVVTTDRDAAIDIVNRLYDKADWYEAIE
jgi:hypothetical protein